MLSLVKHPNLVRLIGYCAEEDHRILVYEYMTNGSLEDHLLGMTAKNIISGVFEFDYVVSKTVYNQKFQSF